MKEKEIINSNKLIAEFMGKNTNLRFIDPYGYHCSWDWIMPVVEKIESIGYPVTINCHKSCYINITSKDASHIMVDFAETKIEAVYNAVVEFIKWFNEHKKTG